jgi:RNA polymerase-binding transcription factor DksA
MDTVMKDHTTILKNELSEVQKQIAALERATNVKPDYGLGEGDPAITRWEMDTVLLQQLRERVATLQHALEGTGAGAYGLCERCGKPINPDRLAILPDTTLCIDCARTA